MMSLLKLLDLRRLGYLAIFLVLLLLAPVSDPDYFWHLRTGQYLLEQHALPAGDIFSYTHAGKPWVLHEWLFEVVIYGMYSAMGEFGVKLLLATLATATLMVADASARKILGKPYLAYGIALAFFVLMLPSVAPRPQLMTFLIFALYLRVLVGFKYCGETRGLLALPPLMVIWVNGHGGYVAGIALLVIFTLCEWMKRVMNNAQDAPSKLGLQRMVLVILATIAASLVNPYFLDHWFYPFQVMGMDVARSYITEWQSPDFHTLPNKGYLALVFGFFILTVYRKQVADITELALPLAFVALGFVAIRHIPLASIVLIPFTAAALVHQPLSQMSQAGWPVSLPAWKERHSLPGKALGDTEYLLNWGLLILMLVGFLIYFPMQQAKSLQQINAIVPVKATEFIQQAGITGRMFHTYHYGGYLIYRLYPEQKVFIDGRADMFGDDFVKESENISLGSAGWEKLFDQYRIDYVLVQRDTPLRQLLLVRGDYKLVYDDEVNSVLLKDEAKFAPIIERYGK